MPKPKDPDGGREGREAHERRGREEHAHDRHEHPEEQDKDRPRRRRMGREHAVHQQIVERRLSGGAPATPETYAKALEEWKQLPGSVVRPPTDEKRAEKLAPKVEDKGAKQE
jgi:hypothetical protein